MKKLLALLLCFTLALPLASCAGLFGDGSDASSESESTSEEAPRETIPGFSGEGTEASPYLITERDDLLRLVDATTDADEATICKDLYFRLDADIDLNGEEWLPIAAFGGIFDGNGHTISNFKVSDATEAKQVKVGSIEYFVNFGLFGVVHGGTVKNLTVSAANVTTEGFTESVGAIAGSVYEGKIEGCTVKDSTVTAANSEYGTVRAGAVTGDAETAIIDSCTVTNVTVTGKNAQHVLRTNEEAYIGGVVGRATWDTSSAELPAEGQIRKCRAIATVKAPMTTSGAGVYAGGIAGTATTLRECAFLGTVEAGNIARNIYAGGITGTAKELVRCFADAKVSFVPHEQASQLYNTAYLYFGGVSGIASRANECSFEGEIDMPNDTSGEVFSGGIIGLLRENGSLKNSASIGTVKAAQKRHSSELLAGGIVASVAEGAAVEGCISSAEVKTSIGEDVGWTVYAGGIAGRLKANATIKSCLFVGSISAYAQKLAQGSVAGFLAGGADFEKCYAKNPVSTVEGACAGELADDTALATATFYVDTLGLSGDVWKIESPNPAARAYPTIKSEITLESAAGGESGGASALLPDGPITSVEDLSKLRMDGVYELAGDIDCNGAKLIPIGSPSEPFVGTLDGKGYKIKNFSIVDGRYEEGNVPTSYFGFFGYNKGTISNLTLEKVNVTAIVEDRVYGGILAAYNAGKITKCRVTDGALYASSTDSVILGGLVGFHFGGSVFQSVAEVSVKADGFENEELVADRRVMAGGLVGIYEGEQSLDYCYATGDVKAIVQGLPQGTTPYAGGLVAECSTNIYNCYAAGNVEAVVSMENPDGTPRVATASGLVAKSHAGVYGSFALGNVRAEALSAYVYQVTPGGGELKYGCTSQVLSTKTAANQVMDATLPAGGIERETLLTANFLGTINMAIDPWVVIDGQLPTLKGVTAQ